MLLVFNNSATKKAVNETVCAFFVEEKGNNAAAMSIFPSNISYSNDGKVAPLHQCKILSFEDHCKSMINGKQKITVKNLIKCTKAELKIYKQKDLQAKRKKIFRSKLYGLNDTRKQFLKCVVGKDIIQETDFKKQFDKYQTRLEEIASPLKTDLYTRRSIVDELKNIREKTNSKENLKIDLISDEIKVIENSILKSLIQAQNVSNNIKSPATSLLSASSTLAIDPNNNSNKNSKNTQNFAVEPQCKWQYNIATPVLVGQAENAIALPLRINPQPQFDIDKLIDGLKNLNEKITNTIHNFTDSFKRSQEQPPQDRTARGRKINLVYLSRKKHPHKSAQSLLQRNQKKRRSSTLNPPNTPKRK